MPAYCRKRSELFTISVFLGGAVTGVVFGYYRDQIRSYFDLFSLHRYLTVFLIFTYLLPPLVFYSAIYCLNALLVRLFGNIVLNEQRKAILKSLVEAALTNQVLNVDPSDLVEEVGWESLNRYWRPQ
jgi:F0F1-type ATP synthase membrane subunit a